MIPLSAPSPAERARSDWFLVRGADGSIKPGVKRSETPGDHQHNKIPEPAKRAIAVAIIERHSVMMRLSAATRAERARSDWFLVRGADGSVKPGVKRSENPRIINNKIPEPAKRA